VIIDSTGHLFHPQTRIGDDGKRFVVRANGEPAVLVELERQVLTVMFYLESIIRLVPRLL